MILDSLVALEPDSRASTDKALELSPVRHSVRVKRYKSGIDIVLEIDSPVLWKERVLQASMYPRDSLRAISMRLKDFRQ